MKIPEIQTLYLDYDQPKWKEVYTLNKEGGEDDNIDFSEGKNVRETRAETNMTKPFLWS